MKSESIEISDVKNVFIKYHLISEINSELKKGILDNESLRKRYRRLYRDGTLANTRFIRFPRKGWRLVETNTKLEKELLSIIPQKTGMGSNRVLFTLKLFLDILCEENDKKTPHYLISSPIKQHIRFTPNTGEPRNCIPEGVVRKRLILRNVWSLNHDKRNGISNQQYTCPHQILFQFEKIFLKRVTTNLRGLAKSYYLNALKKQLKRSIPDKKFKTNQAISASLFELSIEEFDILILASTTFYDFYKYHGVKYPQSSLSFIRRTYPNLYTFYSKFIVLESGTLPPIDDLKFLVTVTSLKSSLNNLVNKYQITSRLSQILELLDTPRKRDALSTKIVIRTDDVFNASLFLDYKLVKKKLMREDKNNAITNFALALFKNKEVLTFIKKRFKDIKLPEVDNSHLIFTGQHRKGREYSSIYEDGIIQGKDNNGKMITISILVKNTMLEDPDKHIKDYLKSIHIPNDQHVFILIDITHPQDIRKISIPNPRMRNTIITEGLGLINIGIFEGFEGVKYLGLVYGALMQARRSSKTDKVAFAIKKLIGYGLDVDDRMREELIFLNNILNEIGIVGDLTQAKWGQIHRFLRKYVERYRKYLC